MNIPQRIEAARLSGDFSQVIAAIPYLQWLGVRLQVEADGPVCVLPYQEMLIGNPVLPALHGGVTGAFLESAAIMSLIATMPTPKLPKTINITVEYLRPGRPVDTYAAGIVTKHGRRVANVRAEAWQRDRGHPIAAASAHFLVA